MCYNVNVNERGCDLPQERKKIMLNVRVNSRKSENVFHGKVRIFDCLRCLLSFCTDADQRYLPVRKVSDNEEYASWPYVLVDFNRVTFLDPDGAEPYELTPKKVEKLLDKVAKM